MSEHSPNSVVGIAFVLILLLLLVVGGLGFYYLTERQQMAMAVAEQARAEEARARVVAEARVRAARATTHHSNSLDQESSLDDDAIRAAVESVLRAQEDAWNRGDLDAFMEHYWKSDELTFSSRGTNTRGWNATLERYRQRYGTPEKMGRLSLSGLETTPLGDSAALVLGQWKLDRENEPVSGNFSLVLRKFDDRWLIVHDHTSQLAEEQPGSKSPPD